MRTQGELKITRQNYSAFAVDENRRRLYGGACGGYAMTDETMANLELATTAHNVANKLDAMGVDGINAIKGLPGFLAAMKEVYARKDIPTADFIKLLGGHAHDYLMQSIQRKDDEPTT